MDLSQIAETPTLQKVILDKPELVEKYGEPIEFYMYDRHSVPTYIKLSSIHDDTGALIEAVRDLVKTKEGKPMLSADQTLPLDIMIEMVQKVVTELGNGLSQTTNA